MKCTECHSTFMQSGTRPDVVTRHTEAYCLKPEFSKRSHGSSHGAHDKKAPLPCRLAAWCPWPSAEGGKMGAVRVLIQLQHASSGKTCHYCPTRENSADSARIEIYMQLPGPETRTSLRLGSACVGIREASFAVHAVISVMLRVADGDVRGAIASGCMSCLAVRGQQNAGLQDVHALDIGILVCCYCFVQHESSSHRIPRVPPIAESQGWGQARL